MAEEKKPQSDLGFGEFRRELIRRFFNSKSYFFLCVSTQLQNVSSIAADLSEDDYLLIGQVMDELAIQDGLFAKLEEFSAIDRFRDFCEHLEEGVVQLRENDPSPENMKRTIEGIAHFWVDALIDVLHAPASRNRLHEMLRKKALPQNGDMGDINDSVVENLYSLASQQMEMTPQAPPPAAPKKETLPAPLVLKAAPEEKPAEDELNLFEKAPQPEKTEPAALVENVAPKNSDTISINLATPEEAAFMLRDEEEPPSVKPASKDKSLSHDAQRMASRIFDPAHEPLAVHESARRQIDGLIKQAQEQLSAISNWPGKWSSLRQHLQTLRETAMIHGVDEIEMLAFKGWRLLEIRAQKNLTLGAAWKKLYAQVAEALHGLSAGVINPQSMPEVMQLSATLSLLIEHPEQIEELVKPGAVNRASEQEKEVVVVSPSETASRHFKLPGEDDAELINLINEVRRDRREQLETPAAEARRGAEAAISAGIASGRQELPGAAKNEKPRASEAAKHPLLAQFHDETEIYFEICEEAIQNLSSNPASRLALDSLELGVYSLKVTARKLGIESCARFPEHVEELIKKTITLGAPLDRALLQSIRDGLEKLKHATRIDDLETPALRQANNQVLKFIKALQEARLKAPGVALTSETIFRAGDHSPADAELFDFKVT